MAHNKKFADYEVAGIAVAPVTTSGALTSSAIDATEFDRATFHFAFGTPLANAAVVAGLGIWQASTSGATFARVTSASFGAITTGSFSNANFVVDVNVNQSYPWLIVSGAVSTSNVPLACVYVLRSAANKPPTARHKAILSTD